MRCDRVGRLGRMANLEFGIRNASSEFRICEPLELKAVSKSRSGRAKLLLGRVSLAPLLGGSLAPGFEIASSLMDTYIETDSPS